MTHQSLKKRYTAKLSANMVGLVISMATQAIIPRGLGPKAYGDFNFLSNFISQLMPFFTLSTSIGFYTKISQRQNEFGLISFYFQFSVLAFITLFVFVSGSQLIHLNDLLWIDQSIGYVYMAIVWGGLTWMVQLLTQIADAYGLTVSTEIARIFQKFVGIVILFLLCSLSHLNLTLFFLYHYVILLFLAITFISIFSRNGHSLLRNWRLRKEQVRIYIKEFYEYSNPLVVYSLIGMIVGILDRWLLQKFAGSIQQGFFGLSYQIGTICFLFTSAMTSLIIREFSIAYANNDLNQMRMIFQRYIPFLYSIAAFFGCFACIQADKITYIFGGTKFAGASMPVAIMALYPIHQTYGQLSGSIFYATGQTALYRNIGIVIMLAGSLFAYIMIAPSNVMGLEAGATGLAIKFVVLQFIGVNVQLWFSVRFLKLQFWRFFVHQLLCLTCLLLLSFWIKGMVDDVSMLYNKRIISFLVSGVLYTLTIVVLSYFFPAIFGLKKKDVRGIASGVNFLLKRI